MKIILFILCFLLVSISYSQTTVSGRVTDIKGKPIEGANVYIEGTYDGAMTAQDGSFTFVTTVTGVQILVVSYLSFMPFTKTGEVAEFSNVEVKLKEDVNSLDAVVITAGNFEAGDKARVSVLSPLDIVTTAGSMGDIVAALQSLPGTQTVGEDGRLFIRGGEAGESQTFIDGLRVAQPYSATVQGVPTRGRFSPFIFDGISFSTGGYSAEYGEALSGVLLLESKDGVLQNQTDISLMSVGLGVGHTKKWEKSSFSLNTAYINLAPYEAIIPDNVTWNKPFETIAGEAIYRKQFNTGIWKIYTSFDVSNFDFMQESINMPEKFQVKLDNNNFYWNTNYKGILYNNWQIHSGFSYGYAHSDILYEPYLINTEEHAMHGKIKLTNRLSQTFKIAVGTDYFYKKLDEEVKEETNETYFSGYDNSTAAVYSEADIFFSKNLAVKVGVRASYNSYLREFSINERLSMAYKVNETSQFSLAYGRFSQAPDDGYLKFSSQVDLEKASHYILNFQYNKSRKLFRAEIYYKSYSDLIKRDTEIIQHYSILSNAGYGYAQGLDIFYRDRSSFKNFEYWLSYSYIDSKRNYQNFSEEATPSFIASYTASLVTKYWIQDFRSQVGLTYNFTSGRPFNNPNQSEFMNDKTKNYNSLGFGWAYLISQQKILYVSATNILGSKNVFGYEYANAPDYSGVYNRRAITPQADRFFFIGFFWTISNDKNKNQLDNL